MNSRSAELELLLACCGPDRSIDANSITELLDRIDPRLFDNLAAWHQVRPMVAQALRGRVANDESGVGFNSQPSVSCHIYQSLHLTAYLRSILSEFEGSGIPVVTFKGPVLAQRLFGDVAMREYADLDLFVRRSDVSSASCVLQRMGFHADFVSNASESQFLKSECELIFRNEADAIVELHWDVAPRLLAFDLDWSGIWARVCTAQFCRQQISVFCDQDALLLLLLHGSKHGWTRLKWLSDLAHFVEVAEIDFERLVRESAELGCRRAVLVGLELAARLFHTSLPAVVMDCCRRDLVVARVCCRIEKQMSRIELPGDVSLLKLRMQCRERSADKLRILSRTLFQPNQADFQRGANSGSRMLYMTRPLRLLLKRLPLS